MFLQNCYVRNVSREPLYTLYHCSNFMLSRVVQKDKIKYLLFKIFIKHCSQYVTVSVYSFNEVQKGSTIILKIHYVFEKHHNSKTFKILKLLISIEIYDEFDDVYLLIGTNPLRKNNNS